MERHIFWKSRNSTNHICCKRRRQEPLKIGSNKFSKSLKVVSKSFENMKWEPLNFHSTKGTLTIEVYLCFQCVPSRVNCSPPGLPSQKKDHVRPFFLLVPTPLYNQMGRHDPMCAHLKFQIRRLFVPSRKTRFGTLVITCKRKRNIICSLFLSFSSMIRQDFDFLSSAR